jgi:hypothetical protein
MYHTDNPQDIERLAACLEHARDYGKRVRLDVVDGSLKVKIGEGIWSAPMASTPDPNAPLPKRGFTRPTGRNYSAECGDPDCPCS